MKNFSITNKELKGLKNMKKTYYQLNKGDKTPISKKKEKIEEKGTNKKICKKLGPVRAF